MRERIRTWLDTLPYDTRERLFLLLDEVCAGLDLSRLGGQWLAIGSSDAYWHEPDRHYGSHGVRHGTLVRWRY